MNTIMEQVITYLKGKCSPISMIVYSSYADGTNNADSDFDALVASTLHKNAAADQTRKIHSPIANRYKKTECIKN